jgi:hypothetical protein
MTIYPARPFTSSLMSVRRAVIVPYDQLIVEKTRDTHVYLPESLYQKLEALAHENDRSITGQIRFMLTQALKKGKK